MLRKPRSKNGTSLKEKLLEAEALITFDEKGCLVWPWAKSAGRYGQIGDPETRKIIYVHRVAWEVYNGPIPDGFFVLHKPVICHNRACFNVDHLYLGTDKDNRADQVVDGTEAKSGLGKFGEEHKTSKLTDDERCEICCLYAVGDFSYRVLGKRFGVSYKQIGNIVNSGRWD